MGGISFMLMSLLQVAVGNTGGGIIDMFIWGVFQPGSNWYWIIIIGPIYAIIYYNVFKWYFNRKHYQLKLRKMMETRILMILRVLVINNKR